MTSMVATPLVRSGERPVAARSHREKDPSVDHPEIRYAKTPDGVHLAYQTIGAGPSGRRAPLDFELRPTDPATRGAHRHSLAALAAPSAVMVSQTVKELVAGSGLTFEDSGEHELKG